MQSHFSEDFIDLIKEIPIYREAVELNRFPILEKHEIGADFPDRWMTPSLAQALASGSAELVLSTGTNHPRMQLIRPPLFLLRSYYDIWRDHPDISHTWASNCPRISLTTVLATEHVMRVNTRRQGGALADAVALDARRLDERTSYINLALDPALWSEADICRMADEISLLRQVHPQGDYHLDCSSYHLAHFVLKWIECGRASDSWSPASIIHAYEFTPRNVGRFLRSHFRCPIVDLFGSTELGYLYYSDASGRYVPYLDKMHAELIPADGHETAYSLIVSSVRNPYMPLVRYRSGDCVQTIDNTADPEKIRRFCGREKEMLRLADRSIFQAELDDWISESSPDIFVYQLRLPDSQRAELSYTTFSGRALDAAAATRLRGRLCECTGLVCSLEHHGHIAIGKSGKYAWLVDERHALG